MCLCQFFGVCPVAHQLAPGSPRKAIGSAPLDRNFLVSEDDLGENLGIGLADNVDRVKKEPEQVSVHPG